MSNIRTLKALYQPISTAATKSVLSSVAQDEKDLAKEQAELSSIMKSAASLGSRFAKDKKAFDIAKKGGFGFNLKEALGTADYTEEELAAFRDKGINVDLKKTNIQRALDMSEGVSEQEIFDQFKDKGFVGNLKDFFKFKSMPDMERDKYIKAGLEGGTILPSGYKKISDFGTDRYKKHGAFVKGLDEEGNKIVRPAMPEVIDDDDIEKEFDPELDLINKQNLEYFDDFDDREAKLRQESYIGEFMDNYGLSEYNPVVREILSNAKNNEEALELLTDLVDKTEAYDINLVDDQVEVVPPNPESKFANKYWNIIKRPGARFQKNENEVPSAYLKKLESVDDVDKLIYDKLRPPMPEVIDDDVIEDEDIDVIEDTSLLSSDELKNQLAIEEQLDALNLWEGTPVIKNILSSDKTHKEKMLDLQKLNALQTEYGLDLRKGKDMLFDSPPGLGGKLLKTPGSAFQEKEYKFKDLETIEDVETFVSNLKEQEKQAANIQMKNVIEQQNAKENISKFLGDISKRGKDRNKKFNEDRDKKIKQLSKDSSKKWEEYVKQLNEEKRIKADRKRFNELRKMGLLDTDRFGSEGPKFNIQKFPLELNEFKPIRASKDIDKIKLGSDFRSIVNRAISEENMDANLGLRDIFKKVGR
tara:strand:+ start:107 stop:2038 length:1932 start_codon:yes stop_codon:yes gene_type:complete